VKRNVLLNIETDEGIHAYRARLLDIDRDNDLGLCEERAKSGIPRGLYPLEHIFDPKTRRNI
jgi:hypothetical protein